MKKHTLTKTVIKEIVKECLFEILAEGLAPGDPSSTNRKRTVKEAFAKSTKPPRSPVVNSKTKKDSPHLDSIKFGKKNEKLDRIAGSVTDDPVLSEMLRDTAHTTLQEQIAAESKKGFTAPGRGDDAQKIVESNNPEEIFGEEAAGKWAQLAFGG